MGIKLSKRYEHLKRPRNIWSSTAERTVKTARGFIDGLNLHQLKSNGNANADAGRNNSIHLVEVEESENAGANSLTPYKGCSTFSSSYGNVQSSVSYTRPN